MASTFRIIEHKLPGQHIREYPMSTRHRQEDVFQIAIKQYIPLDRPDPIPESAVTILGFHGNGFPKETYEPLFEDLYATLRSQAIHVRAIWLSDSSNQGASGVLNEYIQGDQTGWFDHSRDVLHMVNHFREDMPRPIIGLAHSYGCAQLVHLSTMHPRLLSSVILIEPIIFNPRDPAQFQSTGPHPAAFTMVRRDLWPSHEVAAKSLRKAFSYWDPRSVEAYIKHNLRPVPTAAYPDISSDDRSPKSAQLEAQTESQKSNNPNPTIMPKSVTLTTSKAQESWSYAILNLFPPTYDLDDTSNTKWNRLIRPDQHPVDDWSVTATRPECGITMEELAHIRPDTFFVFGAESPMNIPSSQEIKLATAGTRQGGNGGAAATGRVKSVVIQKGSHLVTFEKHSLPTLVKACGDFISEWFQRWKADEELMRQYLARREGRPSDPEMLRLSKDWIETVRGGMGALKPTTLAESDNGSKAKL